eukprot:4556241-Pleurochrysis_carterae.AAC.1
MSASARAGAHAGGCTDVRGCTRRTATADAHGRLSRSEGNFHAAPRRLTKQRRSRAPGWVRVA